MSDECATLDPQVGDDVMEADSASARGGEASEDERALMLSIENAKIIWCKGHPLYSRMHEKNVAFIRIAKKHNMECESICAAFLFYSSFVIFTENIQLLPGNKG